METGPGQYSNRCFLESLGQEALFFFSSSHLDETDSKDDPRRKDRLSNHSDTHMTNPALLCTNFKKVCRTTIFSVSGKILAKKFTLEKPSFTRNKVTEISGVEGFRESLQIEGIAGNASKLISHPRK